MTDNQSAVVLAAVEKASAEWKAAFNSGNAAGCAAQYEADAVMYARPFGTFTGTAEIQAFWQQLIDDGFSDVDYISPEIVVLDDSSAILSSGWKMNKAGGVIHKELWVLQADGTAKLREDDFEAKA
ncbi:YybH family protein [Spongorhabdus nitratireducens]